MSTYLKDFVNLRCTAFWMVALSTRRHPIKITPSSRRPTGNFLVVVSPEMRMHVQVLAIRARALKPVASSNICRVMRFSCVSLAILYGQTARKTLPLTLYLPPLIHRVRLDTTLPVLIVSSWIMLPRRKGSFRMALRCRRIYKAWISIAVVHITTGWAGLSLRKSPG